MTRPAALALLPILGLLGVFADARAAEPAIETQISLIAVDARIIAADPAGGSPAQLELRLGEKVRFARSLGRIAIAATSERLVGLRAGEHIFSEVDYRIAERAAPPEDAALAERLAIVALGHRIVAITEASAGFFQASLSPDEALVQTTALANVGAVVTNRRVLGLTAMSSSFVAIKLSANERVERVEGEAGALSVITDRRILILPANSPRFTTLRRQKR